MQVRIISVGANMGDDGDDRLACRAFSALNNIMTEWIVFFAVFLSQNV